MDAKAPTNTIITFYEDFENGVPDDTPENTLIAHLKTDTRVTDFTILCYLTKRATGGFCEVYKIVKNTDGEFQLLLNNDFYNDACKGYENESGKMERGMKIYILAKNDHGEQEIPIEMFIKSKY